MAMPQAAPKKQPDLPSQPKRSMLAAVTRGKIQSPDRILLYGTEGCGKTTWASNAPGAIFLPAEDGTDRVDVARLPTPRRWSDVMDAIDELRTGKHDFKTFVIDTVDAIEPLCWKYICARDGQESVGSYGYGKGYDAALDEWNIFLAALERLRREKGMSIILLAHSQIKPFKNPEGDDFDRYALNLNVKAAGKIKEWCDSVLFARFEEIAHKDGKTKKVRGVSTGARQMHTLRTAAYDAKNRYSLPETLPLDYAEYVAAVVAGETAKANEYHAAILELLPQLADEVKRAQVAAYVATIKTDAVKLAQAGNKLTALIAAQVPPTETTNEPTAEATAETTKEPSAEATTAEETANV